MKPWDCSSAVIAIAATITLAGIGCSSSSSPNPSGVTGVGSESPTVGATDGGAASVPGTGSERRAPQGFDEVTVRVTEADGTIHIWCLLLARTEAQRARGLMEVTDSTLGGHAGMLFLFDQDTTDGFWMRNTPLPLSLAFLNADGNLVAATDMAPCPNSATTCPIYDPPVPYRQAIEVPQGRLPDLGLNDGSRVEISGATCA